MPSLERRTVSTCRRDRRRSGQKGQGNTRTPNANRADLSFLLHQLQNAPLLFIQSPHQPAQFPHLSAIGTMHRAGLEAGDSLACGKVQMSMTARCAILAKMRHDGCYVGQKRRGADPRGPVPRAREWPLGLRDGTRGTRAVTSQAAACNLAKSNLGH